MSAGRERPHKDHLLVMHQLRALIGIRSIPGSGDSLLRTLLPGVCAPGGNVDNRHKDQVQGIRHPGEGGICQNFEGNRERATSKLGRENVSERGKRRYKDLLVGSRTTEDSGVAGVDEGWGTVMGMANERVGPEHIRRWMLLFVS